MSYVGNPFTHDLFVSYSHGDDGKGNASLQPWSAAFVHALENELRADRRFRQDLRVFLDANHRPGQGIDPMAALTTQLQEGIGGAALLVVLMSPDYLASKWCTDERDWWVARQQQLRLPIDERIAVLRIWPTTEAWPAALCDGRGEPLVGFVFHENTMGPDRPLGWTDPPGQFGSTFRNALLGVTARLYEKLEMMRERAKTLRVVDAEAARLRNDGGQSLYLHGRHEHRASWEQAAMALGNAGYAVVPGEPDPTADTPQAQLTLRQRRVEALAGCDALLLLGTDDGRALDVDLIAVARHDRQSARAHSRRLLPCGVIDTVGPPVATAVRRATARNVQADWLDGTQAPWTPTVREWLATKGDEAESLR